MQQRIVECYSQFFEALTGRKTNEHITLLADGNLQSMESLIDPSRPQLLIAGTFRGNKKPTIEIAVGLKKISPQHLSCFGLTTMGTFPSELFLDTIDTLNPQMKKILSNLFFSFMLFEQNRARDTQEFGAYFIVKLLEDDRKMKFKQEHSKK